MLRVVRNPLSLLIGEDQPSLLHILMTNASTVNKKAGDVLMTIELLKLQMTKM